MGNHMRSKSLKLESLRLDGDTQPRVEIDLDLVAEYAELYAAEVAMPALIVFFDGVDHWLAEGFHRWHAARKAGLEKISCDVRKGTLEEARWFSCSVNQTHGLRRSNADKAKAVQAALRHPKGAKMSDHKIAEYVGVHVNTVAKYRGELRADGTTTNCGSRTGRDGRTTNTANIGNTKKDDEPAPEQEATAPAGEAPQDAKPEPASSSDPSFAAALEKFIAAWRKKYKTSACIIRSVLTNLADRYED